MKRWEFLRETIAAIGSMLESKDELDEHLHHYPIAVHGSIAMNLKRDPDKRPEAWTEFDVLPLPYRRIATQQNPQESEDQRIVRDKLIFEQLRSARGHTLEIDEDQS